MSVPMKVFVSAIKESVKDDCMDVGRHFPLAALADRSVEWTKEFLEHTDITQHVYLMHATVHVLEHIPHPVIWAGLFAATMLVEKFYHDAADRFYARIGHHAHQAVHQIPGGAKVEHIVKRHHAKIRAQAKKPGIRGYIGAYVGIMGEKITKMGEIISGPRPGGSSPCPA